jgi:hypothetical protein
LLPLRWNVLGECVHCAFDKRADQQIRIGASLSDEPDEFRD